MGRPGIPVTDWSQISVGDAVHFFTGAGWKKGTVQVRTSQSTQVLFTHGSTESRITIGDLRNVRRKDPKTGEQLHGQGPDADQSSLFGA